MLQLEYSVMIQDSISKPARIKESNKAEAKRMWLYLLFGFLIYTIIYLVIFVESGSVSTSQPQQTAQFQINDGTGQSSDGTLI